ncbi:MAG: DUF4837 family protein [Flavobacteriaceae bacterium]
MFKYNLVAVVFLVILFSCKEKSNKEERYLPSSGGTLNTLTIVSDDAIWNGEIGDVVRDIFAAPVIGMPQDEPSYTLKHMKTRAFHEFVKKSRTFIELKYGAPKAIKFVNDVYAAPQLGIIVSGQTNEELIAVLKENAAKMSEKIKAVEIDYKMSEIAKNVLNTDEVSSVFGIDISVLFSYRIAKKTNDFMWLRKDIKTGDMNLMIYELPYGTVKRDSTAIAKIVQIRDSIGKVHIPGPVKDSYMITEKSFAPYLGATLIKNNQALETRGIWDVKNDYMAGPFINYIIDDKKNNRQLVLEGFTYAPQIAKRDYMFELEAIIKSITID